MKSSLAYVGAAAEAALSREVESPTVPAEARVRAGKARLKIVAGLTVDDAAAAEREIDAGLQKRKQQIEEYTTDRARLERRLEDLDLVPLAILPTRAWRRICFEANLYRLQPTEDGRVAASSSMLNETYRQRYLSSESSVACSNWGTLLGAVSIIASSVGFGLFLNSWEAFWLCGAASIIPSCILGWATGAIAEKVLENRIAQDSLLRQRAFENLPVSKQCEHLFPGKISPRDSKMMIGIKLPEPPIDVAEILLKARRLDLKVAVTSEAICFTESFHQMFLDEDARVRKEKARLAEEAQRRFQAQVEERRRAAILADPIVYYEHGAAVAILAQFGDFPIEQAVVDMVMNSEQLI